MNQININSKLSINEFILLRNDFKTYNKLVESTRKSKPNNSLKLNINIEVTNPKIEQIKLGGNYFLVSYNAKIRDGEDLVMEVSSDYQMCLNSRIEILDDEEAIKEVDTECKSLVGNKIMTDINGLLQKSILKFTIPIPLSLANLTTNGEKNSESERKGE